MRQRRAANVVSLSGGQTISRALALLKIVAAAGREGMSLPQVAERSGLHRATAHRLLNVLVAEHLVAHDETHRYHAGVELWMLGEAAARQFRVRDAGREAVDALARETEDTAYLTMRSGFTAVCVARGEGAFPIRTLSLSVGDRRPLGVGSGSLAILAFMPEEQREEALAMLPAALERYPRLSISAIRRQAEQARELGYSFVGGTIIPGMFAVGVPVLDRGGHAVAALSVAAIEARLAEPRRAKIVALLKAQARALSARLGEKKTASRG
jgi:DNA-binding IclR family transcriptional regulator